MLGARTDGNRTLFRLGVGNMVTACFGGVSGNANLVGTAASHRAGARTAASVLAFALIVLLAVLLLPPVIALIPRVVIAGMLLVISVQMVDAWTVQMIRKVVSRRVEHARRMTLDLFVIALVTGAAVAVDMVVAVGVGVVVAILSFLFWMSRSVVRRAHYGDTIRSRRSLEPRLAEILSAEGRTILVLELQGPLFFGTAEDLARRIELAADGVVHVILDLKRVNEIDSTGARILLQIHARLTKEGRHLLLSHVDSAGAVASVPADVGVTAAVSSQRVFEDTDHALEWAENHLIVHHVDGAAPGTERRLEEMDILAGLDKRECDVLRGSSPLAGDGRVNRLATFSAGTVFGRAGGARPDPRSASVEADEELVCYVLSDVDFERLRQDHPAVAIRLVTNLGRELSRRLRQANLTIYQLEG